MENQFVYPIADTENLIFSGTESRFDLSSKAEGGNQELIARFNAGKWSFENDQQRKLFLALFDTNREKFFRAFKSFQHSLKEAPKLYEFTCLRRKISIRVTKLKKDISEKIQDIFYPYRTFYPYEPKNYDSFVKEDKRVKTKDRSPKEMD